MEVDSIGSRERGDVAGFNPASAFAALGALGEDQPAAELALTVQAPGSGYTGLAYANLRIEEASANKVDISGVVVSVGDATYTGEAARSNVTVTLSGQTMTPDVEYTVDYGNYVDAGEAKVIVRGVGAYEGQVEKTYTIHPASIAGAQLTLSQTTFPYNSEVQKPTVTAVGGKALTPDTDFDTVYDGGDFTKHGTYHVTVTGKGNYTGITATADYEITQVPISECIIEDIVDQTYAGHPIVPPVGVHQTSGLVLYKDVDFTVEASNNVNVGENTATATITGIGNYCGSADKTFSIVPADIAYSLVEFSPTWFLYNGNVQKPDQIRVEWSDMTLNEGTDYTVKYSDDQSTELGKYDLWVEGAGNITGATVHYGYYISKNELKDE